MRLSELPAETPSEISLSERRENFALLCLMFPDLLEYFRSLIVSDAFLTWVSNQLAADGEVNRERILNEFVELGYELYEDLKRMTEGCRGFNVAFGQVLSHIILEALEEAAAFPLYSFSASPYS